MTAESASPIRAIIFDLGDVLVTGLTGVGDRLTDALGYPPDEILRQFRDDAMLDLLLGDCSEDAYLERLRREHGWSLSVDEVKAVLREHFERGVPGMAEVVTGLARHYPLYLLSDHGREWVRYIESRHPALGLFRRKFFSFDLHRRKNDPETYKIVLSAIGLPAAECLFIDDRAVFRKTAEGVGLRTIAFEDSHQLRRELERFGVEIGNS